MTGYDYRHTELPATLRVKSRKGKDEVKKMLKDGKEGSQILTVKSGRMTRRERWRGREGESKKEKEKEGEVTGRGG